MIMITSLLIIIIVVFVVNYKWLIVTISDVICMYVLQDQETALHYAADYGKNDCVKLLLDRGATVDAKDDVS